MTVHRTAALALLLLALAACGPTPSPSPSPSHQVWLRGQLVAIKGATLTVAATNGNNDVPTNSATTFWNRRTTSLAEVKVGDCIIAAGTNNASGGIDVQSLVDVPASCSAIPTPTPAPSPTPSSAPSPTSSTPSPSSATPSSSPKPQIVQVRGQASAVSSTSISVSATAGGVQVVNVSASTPVVLIAPISLAGLIIGQCVSIPMYPGGPAEAVFVDPSGSNGCLPPTPAPLPSATPTG